MFKNIISVLAIVTFIAGCSTNGGLDGGIKKSDAGSVAGAIGGAWLGSNVGKGKGNIIGIAAGTLLGAYLGNQVGSSLDRADMAYYNKTSQFSLEEAKTGVTTPWNNPDTGNKGTITPVKTFQTAEGVYCREFSQTITVGGKTKDAFGTACRQEDGSWKIEQ